MKLLMLGSASYKSSLTYFRLITLSQALAKLGWDVTVMVPSADKYNNFTPDPSARVSGITLVQPWQPATRNMLVNLVPYVITGLAAVLKRRTDMVYVYKPTPITIIGLAPKLLFRTPLIVDMDDLGSEVMRLEKQSKLLVWLVSASERLAVRWATAVVVASTYLESSVRSHYPHKPVIIISNGVDPEEYPLLPIAKPRHALYYFGALNRLSLIEPLLRALPSVVTTLPDVQVYILGGGEALAAAKQLVDHLKIGDNVHFSGWIEKQGIRDYVQFADVALCVQPDIPTVRAASNVKVFQYMALGTVPVVSDVGDLASYVGAGTSGSVGRAVAADNPAALANALTYLLGHGDLRVRMAKLARRRVEAMYSWERLARQLEPFLLEHIPARSQKTPPGEIVKHG